MAPTQLVMNDIPSESFGIGEASSSGTPVSTIQSLNDIRLTSLEGMRCSLQLGQDQELCTAGSVHRVAIHHASMQTAGASGIIISLLFIFLPV